MGEFKGGEGLTPEEKVKNNILDLRESAEAQSAEATELQDRLPGNGTEETPKKEIPSKKAVENGYQVFTDYFYKHKNNKKLIEEFKALLERI